MNAVDMVPMCRTVSWVARYEPDESSDTSRTDTVELDESDIEDCDLWMDLWEDRDCPVFIAGSILMMMFLVTLAVIRIWAPERSSDGRRGMTHARGNLGARRRFFPPDSARALPAVFVKDVEDSRDDCTFPEWDVCYTGINSVNYRYSYVDGDIYLIWLCLLKRPSGRDSGVWDNDNVNDEFEA